MRILVLSKRQYTGKDLLDDRYGRLFEIPAALAAHGHEVRGLALSYRSRCQGSYRWDDARGLEWYSLNALPLGLWRYFHRLKQIAEDFSPDLVWACSDAFHAILGWRLCTRFNFPLVIDLYDNFESFTATKLPGVGPLFRAACRHADGLTLVSHVLDEYVASAYGVSAPRVVVGNGVRKELFFPRERGRAREALRLPQAGRLIGTAGSITANRGIEDLFEAFIQLAEQDAQLWLVFAGPRDAIPSKYRHERIVDLGMLRFEQIPLLFSALDVGVVCNRDSDFGRFCFPQKLYEILACGTPVVAAASGDVRRVFATQPRSLYPPGDSGTLAQRIKHHLEHPASVVNLSIPSWQQLGEVLENFFLSLTGSRRN